MFRRCSLPKFAPPNFTSNSARPYYNAYRPGKMVKLGMTASAECILAPGPNCLLFRSKFIAEEEPCSSFWRSFESPTRHYERTFEQSGLFSSLYGKALIRCSRSFGTSTTYVTFAQAEFPHIQFDCHIQPISNSISGSICANSQRG
jgi:hypothetical protein